MAVDVIVTTEFEGWYNGLTDAAKSAVGRVVALLEERGTSLGYPFCSSISGSSIALWELRTQHMGEPYRILYVFDPMRQAILLVGGNKVGKGNRWYGSAVRLAERLYVEYLKEIAGG